MRVIPTLTEPRCFIRGMAAAISIARSTLTISQRNIGKGKDDAKNVTKGECVMPSHGEVTMDK